MHQTNPEPALDDEEIVNRQDSAEPKPKTYRSDRRLPKPRPVSDPPRDRHGPLARTLRRAAAQIQAGT